MPAGVANPYLGYVSFCAVKLVGYSIAARFISHIYERPDRNSLTVGGTRTLIGMAAGAIYYALWSVLPPTVSAGSAAYLAGLIPVRLSEWWLLIFLFYDRSLQKIRTDWAVVVLATMWSYAVDVPAIAGFIATGGVWVC